MPRHRATRQSGIQTTLHPVAPVADQATNSAFEGLRRETQQVLQLLSERVDTLYGLRGTPEFFADVHLRGNRLRQLGTAITDTDAQSRGGALSKTVDGLSYDAQGLAIINIPLGKSRGNAVPFEQLEARLTELLSNPTFTGTVTVATLIVTAVFQHSGTTFGVFNTTPATQQAAIADLTDNTGATPNNTIENVPASTGDGGGAATVSAAANVATVASVNTALTAVENNIADLAAKVDALTATLRTFGFIAP
jgi:hypothetical protein